ncbi:hypothetical protein ACWDWO_25885 [Actinopolymorpha singaporensis]|uniref:Uncharacterized protein n=1 Tax=Actinopolymorpha singaporensis TaxID=117157 RepID=A0A1H1MUN2_9ACTN|nr:hypothetical protein [Actinopolymorpha singaporensis]SDR90416.1 hypothetical protein SAMN04489717_0971 [Actinopolymorpha singaporensis]
MPTFPISHTASWSDPAGRGFHISATGHISAQGQLYLQVLTNTNSWGLGFTSGTSALAMAGDGTVVWASGIRTAGVDAKSVFWGRSSRTDTYYNEWIPGDKLAQVESLQFLLGHDPHDRWAEDWAKLTAGLAVAAKSVVEIITDISTVIKDVKVS